MESDPAVTNQAMLMTPPGTAALAVVRAWGPGIGNLLQSRVSPLPHAGRSVHATLRDSSGQVVDDAVVMIDASTSKVDFCLHGGLWVVEAWMRVLRAEGFQILDPYAGEQVSRPQDDSTTIASASIANATSPSNDPPAMGFPSAHLSSSHAPMAHSPSALTHLPMAHWPDNALDATGLMESEVARYLPAARTIAAAQSLTDQPRLWREALAAIRQQICLEKSVEQAASKNTANRGSSHPSAGETHLPEKVQQWLRERLIDTSLRWLLEGAKIAILGIPNAGKSTLANRLFGQERSITADLPGTTRDWVEGWANLDGLPARVIDTPGMHLSPDPLEQEAIRISRTVILKADVRLLVLDATVDLAGGQAQLLADWPDALVVINKTDRPCRWTANSSEKLRQSVKVAATAGTGVDTLVQSIKSRLGCGELPLKTPACWTIRQRNLVALALAGQSLENLLEQMVRLSG